MALFRLCFRCSFLLNTFWRDALISFRLCRTWYHCKIQVKFDIGSHPPSFGWVMALFRLSFCWCVVINNFWRDALILLLEVCRRIYHCKIQDKFDNHLQNFGWVIALFRLSFCCCVDIGFHSITFVGMQWFYWKFAEGYIIVKNRSSSILVIIRKILGKLWPFFDLLTFRDRMFVRTSVFFPFSYQMVGTLSRRHIRFSEF